jgi:multidrug efflux system membrane fusion protein
MLMPGLLAAGGCATQAPQPERRMAAPVLVATVETRSLPLEETAVGTAEAYSTVSVKSLVSGALDQVNFTEGQEVSKDALLFTIDPRPFQVELQRAQANLARDNAQRKQAEANKARDEANARNAVVEKQRYQVLYDKGVTAREQLDQATAAADALEAAVRADQAAIENALQAIQADQAAIESVKLNLEYCYIRAPIEGRTGSLLVHKGNIVKSNDTTLVVIHQAHPIYVDFSIPERDLPALRRFLASGKVPVKASSPGDAGAPSEGVLSFVDNSVDVTTGTILLKGLFANKDNRLWPGQFVDVKVTLSVQPDAIVVPSQAVQTGQSGQFVFVVKSDMTVESRPVTVSRVVGDIAVIEKGLQPGETVVTDGQIRLVPGALVQIKTVL